MLLPGRFAGAEGLGGGVIHENFDTDLRCLPDMAGEEFGMKERGLFGNDGDVVFQDGMICLQSLGDFDDFRSVPGKIGRVSQVDKRGGLGMLVWI